MTYQRRASTLHAARAGVSTLFLVALATLALVYSNPLVLGCLLIVTVAVARLARIPGAVTRALRFALPFGLAIALLNPFVSHNGLTVIARLGEVGPFGRVDITLEALAAGGVLALKAVLIVLVAAIASAAVDPDELLALFRRVSFHSALTAALATRMVPLLAADSRRLSEAQRCRMDSGRRDSAARIAIAKAVVGGALDRALDIAATLELRGYGTARRAPRLPRPWSRHDLAFAAAALGLLALDLGRLAGWAAFVAYPTLDVATGAEVLTLCALLATVALAPFIDRRGIE